MNNSLKDLLPVRRRWLHGLFPFSFALHYSLAEVLATDIATSRHVPSA